MVGCRWLEGGRRAESAGSGGQGGGLLGDFALRLGLLLDLVFLIVNEFFFCCVCHFSTVGIQKDGVRRQAIECEAAAKALTSHPAQMQSPTLQTC